MPGHLDLAIELRTALIRITRRPCPRAGGALRGTWHGHARQLHRARARQPDATEPLRVQDQHLDEARAVTARLRAWRRNLNLPPSVQDRL